MQKSAHSDHFYATYSEVLLWSILPWFPYQTPDHPHQSSHTNPAAQLKPVSTVCPQETRQIPNQDHPLPLGTFISLQASSTATPVSFKPRCANEAAKTGKAGFI